MKKDLIQEVDRLSDTLVKGARQIWEKPELAYKESFACSLTKEMFREHGFSVQEIEGMPTAYVAQYGQSEPVIAILGEYDALPQLSQKVQNQKDPVVQGEPGHGCGHNILGMAGIGACLALQKTMKDNHLKGSIRYYSCPAEEVLSGKTQMQLRGAFDGIDCALAWHPLTYNGVYGNTTDAMVSVEFQFHGLASHAGSSPELGRSALDAVEIMNVSTNYLREHVTKKSSIHYVTTNGGIAPNIVPAEASVWYYIRAAQKNIVYDIFDRIINCAKGAALATDTTVDYLIKADCYDTAPNSVLEDVLLKNLRELGKVPFTEKEYAFAKEMMQSVPQEWIENDITLYGLNEGTILPDYDIGRYGHGFSDGGSSDVGDVSHLVPLASFALAGVPVGVPFHSWQATASFGSSIADVIVVHAAKIFACAAYDLLTDSTLLETAKTEFHSTCQDYQTRLKKSNSL